MSVIFEALRKVRQPQEATAEAESREKRSANVHTVKSLVFSPQGLLGLSLVALLLGLAVYYGEGYISSLMHVERPVKAVGPKKMVIPPQNNEVTQASELKEDLANEVPPSPKDISYKSPQPGKLYLPAEKEVRQPVKEVPAPAIQYLPPKREEQRARPESTMHEINRPSNTLGELSNRSHKDDLPAIIDTDKPKGSQMENAAVPPLSLQRAKRGSPFDGQLKGRAAMARPLKAEVIPKALADQETLQKPERQVSLVAEVQEKQSKEKTTRISRLVSRIQGAMAQNDKAKVNELLPKLVQVKGKDDPFVLKLQAFWYIKQGQYDSAKKLLIKVLGRDPKDLEAGLNMAIIEIRTGKLEKARKRLKGLRDLHEDSRVIPELLRKING